MSEPKQVIVVRMKYPDADGKLRKLRFGKLAAQVAHASMGALFSRRVRFENRQITGIQLTKADAMEEDFPIVTIDRGQFLVIHLTGAMIPWCDIRFKKIVLVADSEEQLVEIHELAVERKLPAALIEDHGLTEFHGILTKTAVGIGPAEPELIDEITGRDGLVPCRLA